MDYMTAALCRSIRNLAIRLIVSGGAPPAMIAELLAIANDIGNGNSCNARANLVRLSEYIMDSHDWRMIRRVMLVIMRVEQCLYD
jgi:hypothetical protein